MSLSEPSPSIRRRTERARRRQEMQEAAEATRPVNGDHPDTISGNISITPPEGPGPDPPVRKDPSEYKAGSSRSNRKVDI